MRRLVLAVLFSLSLHADDAAIVARMVNAETIDSARLEPALRSGDPLTRATAARVAMVRGVTALAPALRQILAAESNPDAAREQVRALTLLGDDDDVAFVVSQLSRFPSSMDDTFTDALARTGAPRALDLYFRHRTSLRDPGLSGTLPYWRIEADFVTGASARILGAGDVKSWTALTFAFTDSRRTLDTGVATAALGSSDPSIRAATVWHLLARSLDDAASVPPTARDLAKLPRADAPTEEAFGRELLRRLGGAARVESPAVLEWLRGGSDGIVGRLDIHSLLTRKERRALGHRRLRRAGTPSIEIDPPSFTLPLVLPRGLAPKILAATQCTGSWIGVAAVVSDRAGRVQDLDLKEVVADPGCAEALRTIARLSLARPTRFGAGSVAPLLVLRAAGRPPCFDEMIVQNAVTSQEPVYADGTTVKAPKVKRRAEPEFPESVREKVNGSVIVVAEAVISAEGCVRDVRLVSQSPFPELNRSAIVALTKWTFEPGTLNGVPVDVLFNLTINFSVR